jgi:hypothetical protein
VPFCPSVVKQFRSHRTRPCALRHIPCAAADATTLLFPPSFRAHFTSGGTHVLRSAPLCPDCCRRRRLDLRRPAALAGHFHRSHPRRRARSRQPPRRLRHRRYREHRRRRSPVRRHGLQRPFRGRTALAGRLLRARRDPGYVAANHAADSRGRGRLGRTPVSSSGTATPSTIVCLVTDATPFSDPTMPPLTYDLLAVSICDPA